jgi:elongation factor P
MAKISANSISLGHILVYKDDLWKVAKKPEHVKPGKGPAYVQLELKNLKTGTKLNDRISSSDTVEKAELEQRQYQFLYPEGENLVFMDNENYEQITLPKTIAEDQVDFLQDGMIVEVELYDEKPLSIKLPSTVVLTISETDPTIKGSTVTSSYKPAIMENGIRVMVPPYLSTGEKIVVKTEDATFVERAK